MQYVKKLPVPPATWDAWFTTATNRRSYDYGVDYSALNSLPLAKEFLLAEQSYLCAYCQQKLKSSQASIEHVVPKEYNTEMSTSYFNLVAVCKNTPKDYNGKDHCDKHKLSKMIAPLIFVSASQTTEQVNHRYFQVYSDGMIEPKATASTEDIMLATVFIETLNLNHNILREKRKQEGLDPIIQATTGMGRHEKQKFLKFQFEKILLNPSRQFRSYLLIYLANKLGIS